MMNEFEHRGSPVSDKFGVNGEVAATDFFVKNCIPSAWEPLGQDGNLWKDFSGFGYVHHVAVLKKFPYSQLDINAGMQAVRNDRGSLERLSTQISEPLFAWLNGFPNLQISDRLESRMGGPLWHWAIQYWGSNYSGVYRVWIVPGLPDRTIMIGQLTEIAGSVSK